MLQKDIFVAIDIETTGLDSRKDKIIEIAAVKFSYDGIIDTFSSLINPLCVNFFSNGTSLGGLRFDFVNNSVTFIPCLPFSPVFSNTSAYICSEFL